MQNEQKNDLVLPSLGLGAWVLGGDSWGGTKDKDSIEAISVAIDLGLNFIDTAPIYGVGKSEKIVGKACKGKREKVIIATKCGLLLEGGRIKHNLSKTSIVREAEHSLKRLRTEYIDLYQCHNPDTTVPIEETALALEQLKKEGKIKHIGMSNYRTELMNEFCAVADVSTTQDRYSLLDRDIEKDLIPVIQEQRLSLLTYGSLAGGILTGKYQVPPQLKKSDARKFFYDYYSGPAFERTSQLLEQLSEIGKPLNELAINWVRQQKGVSCVLVGCRNRQQVETNMQALTWDLTVDEMNRINEIIKEYD